MELEHINSGRKKRPKKEKKEKRKKKDAKMAAFFTGPSVPDPTDLSLRFVDKLSNYLFILKFLTYIMRST